MRWVPHFQFAPLAPAHTVAQAKNYPRHRVCLGKLPSTASTLTWSCSLIPTVRFQVSTGLRAAAWSYPVSAPAMACIHPSLPTPTWFGEHQEMKWHCSSSPCPGRSQENSLTLGAKEPRDLISLFSFIYQSCSTSAGLKHRKGKRDKLIKDSETQSLLLLLSSRLPGFFSLPSAANKPKSEVLAKTFLWWPAAPWSSPHVLKQGTWHTHPPDLSRSLSSKD